MGGALAALCALDLQLYYNASSANPKDVRLLTLGQVGVCLRDACLWGAGRGPQARRRVRAAVEVRRVDGWWQVSDAVMVCGC